MSPSQETNLQNSNPLEENRNLKNELAQIKKEFEDNQWGLQKTNEAIKILYKELEKKNEELRKFDQLKSDFVSTVSHELRTPLAITTEGISLVLEGIAGSINRKQKNFLTTAKENLERLTKIINDLLDISKIEAGRLDLKRSLVDFNQLLRSVVGSYKIVASGEKITLSLELPDKDVFLFVDGDKIIQVFNNLINNAIKFSKKRGRIDLRLSVKNDNAVCEVHDYGIGIAPENMSKLFGKFQQFARASDNGRSTKGTGLGLSIAKALTELHGGSIEVKSKIGQGTSFSVILPTYRKAIVEFYGWLDKEVRESKKDNKELSLILVELKNVPGVRKNLPTAGLRETINKMVLIIEHLASRPKDRALIDKPDRICLVLPETNKVGASIMARRIKKDLLKNKYRHEGKEIKVDIALSFVAYPLDAKTKDDLMRLAQEALQKPKMILLATDDNEIYKSFQARAKNLGYEICRAKTDQETRITIRDRHPDLLILDNRTLHINGYEIYGRLKENPNTAYLPVVMLTGGDAEAGKIEGVVPGLVSIIQKTVNFDEIVNKIGELL